MYDLTRPAEPRPVSFLDLSGPCSRGTHWVGFTIGTHAYLSTGTPDSRPTNPLDDQFPVIVDLARRTALADAAKAVPLHAAEEGVLLDLVGAL